MADEKRLALTSKQLKVDAANSKCAVERKDGDVERKARMQAAKLTHNEQETKLSAVDAKLMDNKQGTRAQVTSVDMKAKNDKTEINLTQVDVTKDAKDNSKAVVTAANITKDAEGNVSKMVVTNAGAGQSFNVPIKGNKKIGGFRVKHEFTVLKEEQGEQKLFSVFSVSPYAPTMRAEKWEALKKLNKLFSRVPRRVKLRLCWKILLLIFYTFQLFYPLITFLVDIQYVPYNLVCIVISGIGFGLQLLEFDQLIADLKMVWSICGCSKSGNYDNNKAVQSSSGEPEISSSEEICKCKKQFCKCCPSAIREFASIALNEILLYATVICTIMGFVNEKTWEFQNFLSYIDCALLAYSIIMEVFLPRWYHLRWIWGAISTLLTEYYEAANKHVNGCNDICTRYITPLRYTPVFFIVMLVVLQLSMLGIITVRIYADNFFALTNTTRNGTEYVEEVIRPEEGMYHVKRYTWYTIIGGIVVPFLSIVTYFIINQYWLWQPLHYTGQHDSAFVPQNTMIGSMSDADKWIIFAFDPFAWVAMILLLASFIAFCTFGVGSDYDGGTILDGGFPSWVPFAHILCYIIMCFSFMGANIQTVAFGCFIYFQPCCLLIVCLQMFRRPRYRIHY